MAEITPEIAVLGIDDDCSTCAGAGLERLAEAAPDIDWLKVLHDTRHPADGEDWDKPYWCEHCRG